MIEHIAPIFRTPEEHLACDESMLDLAEETGHSGFLRFFESCQYFVVLGYGKKVAEEVFEEACRARNIPILRRCSGGGTVLQGPGCFNFSLVVPMDSLPGLDTITGANSTIMHRHRECFAELLDAPVLIQGISDLTIKGMKFSGNAQRRKRRCLLFHGSFLLRFDLKLITEVLPLPPQQPEYRGHRQHDAFLRNIGLDQTAIEEKLALAWNAEKSETPAQLFSMVDRLVREKYCSLEWNERF